MTNVTRRLSIMDSLFSRLERGYPSDRFILKGLLFAIVGVGITLIISISTNYATSVPVSGGSFSEGIIGIPRFVNPALAITRADQDMVALVYRGLLRQGPNNTLVPDIAESINLADDGRTYDVTLRKDVVFHDNTPLTAEDVAFTINLIQNPDLKSPLRGNWNDVSVTVLNEYELSISLEESYTPFMENFTLGIMPKHIWGQLPIEQLPFSQYNTEPIGAGPFRIQNVKRDDNGLIDSYALTNFSGPSITPNLSSIILNFYQNEALLKTALDTKEISSTVYLPNSDVASLKRDGYQIIETPLPRVFGVFFNQNRSAVLRDRAVRDALEKVTDRAAIVENALFGFGIPTTMPLLAQTDVLQFPEALGGSAASSTIDEAKLLLKRGGWVQNTGGVWEKRIDGVQTPLSISIKTSNNRLFSDVVNIVANRWRELGVEVSVEQYEQSGLVQSVIRPRDFEALLFGMDMNRTQDLFPFWHSSQKADPGLNIAQYTNLAVDKLLEEARVMSDESERITILEAAAVVIKNEQPAIFLFAPTMVYVVDSTIKTTELPTINRPSDRFMNITNWYAKTNSLWPLFWKNKPE